jgi:hypothetical protein
MTSYIVLPDDGFAGAEIFCVADRKIIFSVDTKAVLSFYLIVVLTGIKNECIDTHIRMHSLRLLMLLIQTAYINT